MSRAPGKDRQKDDGGSSGGRGGRGGRGRGGGGGGGRGGRRGGGGQRDDAKAKEAEAQAAAERKQKEEAEAKRKAEEAAAAAERERKLKEEQELKKAQEEKEKAEKQARAKVDEDQKAWETLSTLRAANLKAAASRPPIPKNLSSELKKVEQFKARLKLLDKEQVEMLPALLQQAQSLNLTKFVNEIVNNLAESKLVKTSDVTKSVQVASCLHQRYAEFTPLFLNALIRYFGFAKIEGKLKKIEAPSEGDEKSMLTRLRGTLRLLTELQLAGVFDEAAVLRTILADLIAKDKDDDPEHVTLSMVVSFLKYGGEDFAGTVARSKQALYKLINQPLAKRASLLPANEFKTCAALFDTYFNTIAQRVQKLYTLMKQREKKNARMKFVRGEVPERLVTKEKELKESFEKLHPQAILLADLMDKDAVVLPDVPDDEDDEFAQIIKLTESKEAPAEGQSLFDDEDTRSFYENLSDLRLVVPPVMLQEGHEKEKARERRLKEAADAEKAKAEGKADNKEEDETQWEIQEDDWKRYDTGLGVRYGDQDDDEEYYREEAEAKKRSTPMDLLLLELPQAFNRDSIDNIAAKFCFQNNKANRARLVEFLYRVHRSQQDLLPYYARLIATLNQHMKDIGDEMVGLLTSEFYRLLHRKDQINIESRQKNIRYIAELTKFKVAPNTLVFKCWHLCMNNFVGNNVIVVCTMLEQCGRWLYRNAETFIRCTRFLDRMMALKQAKFMDGTLSNLVESAYLTCKPPTATAIVKAKVRTPLHQFIRWQLYQVLNEKTVEDVYRMLRKLKWDSETSMLVLKCLANVANVKYAHIGELASVASGLNKYHPIGVPLVDAVLEEIRVGLELNDASQRQRRIAYIRYLGELYTYQMLQAQVIFDTLYLLITFGHTLNKDGQIESPLDPPSDFFRLRLICVLLDTCGEYFERGPLRKRLDRFLVYLQRYLMLKDPLPVDAEFLVRDLFEKLRPKMARFKNLEEAQAKIVQLENERKRGPGGQVDKLVSLNDVKKAEDAAKQGAASPSGSPSPTAAAAGSPASAASGAVLPVDPSLGSISEDEAEGDEGDEGEEGEEDDDDEKKSTATPEASSQQEPNQPEEPLDDGTGEGEGEDEDDAEDYARERRKDEDEFALELERMIQDSVEARKFEKRPAAIGPVANISNDLSLAPSKNTGTKVVRDEDDSELAVFSLMTRNAKGKQQTQQLLIPLDYEIAQSSVNTEAEKNKEKEDIKRMVLRGLEAQASEPTHTGEPDVNAVWPANRPGGRPQAWGAVNEEDSSDPYQNWNFRSELRGGGRGGWRGRGGGGGGRGGPRGGGPPRGGGAGGGAGAGGHRGGFQLQQRGGFSHAGGANNAAAAGGVAGGYSHRGGGGGRGGAPSSSSGGFESRGGRGRPRTFLPDDSD